MTSALLSRYQVDAKIIIVAGCYYLAAVSGYLLAFQDSTILPAWPPSGIALALIILFGRKAWPGITIGALVSNLMAFWNMPDIPAQALILTSSGIAIAHTMEALIGNFLVKEWIKNTFPFEHTVNAFRFLFTVILMSLIGSSLSVGSLVGNNLVPADSMMLTWLSMWVGNGVGILLFTPFILSLFKKYNLRMSIEKAIETAVFCLGILLIVYLVQASGINEPIERALPYLVIPFMLWLAFRFPLFISATAIVFVSVMSIYATIHGEGPFVLSDAPNSMMLLQMFIGVVSICTIILAAAVRERAEAQRSLKQFNENLEEMVKARTTELNNQVDTRKKAEAKLLDANSELKKRNEELDNFVYSVSHDLRAPIASVLGLINLAKQEDDLTMKDMYFDMINSSALQQDNFIREILDQSRNSRLDVKREPVYFKQLVAETFDQLEHANTAEQSIKKTIRIDQADPFYCDSWRLKVILNNLVSNAIRYRSRNKPEISVEVSVFKGKATIVITDNGRGISDEHLAKVYDMFYRATDDGAGSGLGLYIVKETIDKLNGTIHIESEVGKGTRVMFEIPEVKKKSPKRLSKKDAKLMTA